MDYTILSPIHLGSGRLGQQRRAVLETLAAENECFWNGKPSIGRWLTGIADERIFSMKKTMPQIVRQLIENGRASTQEELIAEFEFEASEKNWSIEEIRAAIKSPWFPQI